MAPARTKRKTGRQEWLVVVFILPALLIGLCWGWVLNNWFGNPPPPPMTPKWQKIQLLCRSDRAHTQWKPCVDRHGVMFDEYDEPTTEILLWYENRLQFRQQ